MAPFRRSLLDDEPFQRRIAISGVTPAVDISETDKAYEVTVDLLALGTEKPNHYDKGKAHLIAATQ